MTTKLSIKDYTAVFDPSFTKDNLIAQAISDVLANSRQEILKSLIPSLEKSMSKKVLEISNKITRHFPYDEMFPDTEQ